MKKLSICILIIMLIGITALTTFTLMNQKIEDTQVVKKVKSVEKATSNLTENELNEVYNINLNGKRHRLKCNYLVTFENSSASIYLRLYLDGFEIYTGLVDDDFKANDIDEVFSKENNYLTIEEEDIKVLNEDNDYLLVEISSDLDHLKKEYFVWNEKRDPILEHILVLDESIIYESVAEENIFYDEDTQTLAKIEDNEIYSLEEKEEEDTLYLEEYVYKIGKNKYQKELKNTYEVTKKEA